MLTEQAIVTRCNGDEIEVELQRQSVCGGCELNQGCGTGALGRLLGRRSKPLVIPGRKELRPGDRVLLRISETALVRISLLIYGLPLLGMTCAGLLAVGLFDAGEWLVVLASAAGFYAGYKLASIYSRDLTRDLLLPGIVDIDVNPVIESRS